MKKQLLIAAVAATMTSVAIADISIKGDATLEYANIDNGNTNTSSNAMRQRVRLHTTGKSGDTTVKLGLRNDGATRVSNGARSSEGARASGSNAGLSAGSSQFNVDYLYLTTKVGALNIKAGDWWDTTGLGVARKGKADADRIEFSTNVEGWKLAVETGADSSSTVLTANGKIAGFATTFEHNTGVAVDGVFAVSNALGSTAATATNRVSGFDAVNHGDYTDVSIKGMVGSVGVAAEYFAGTNDTRGSIVGLNDDADAAVVHVWTKASDIVWHAVYATTDEGVAGITGNGNKWSPLGVSILANAPGVNGAGAIGNFGDSEDEVFGVRADMKLAGLDVQVAVGNLELNKNNAATDLDDSFYDIIVKRPLGKGSDMQFSYGSWNDVDSAAAKISVKF